MRAKNIPIARQLMTLMVVTTAMVLAVTWAVFISYELYNARAAATAKVRTLARVIASNSTAALAFQDVDDANSVLSALRAEETITAAALYDSKGAPFATYRNAAATAPRYVPPDGYHLAGQSLTAVEPIVQAGGGRLGTLYLQADLRFITEQLLAYAGVGVAGLAGAMLLAYLISRVLQKRISVPILALADTSRAVSERGDYSVRAPVIGTAELGALTVAFNQMLGQIQEQHATLQMSEKRLRTQLDRLDLLNKISRALAERQDLQSIFQAVLENLETSLGVDAGCVLLCAETQGHLRPVSTRACPGLPPPRWRPGIGLVAEAELGQVVTSQICYMGDIAKSSQPFLMEAADSGFRALVCAPLLAERKVLGVLLSARREPDSFSEGEIEFLRQLTEHVALAARQTQLYNDLQIAYEEVRHSQQAAMQQERLKALGQIASGVAHDINNAMSPISLYVETLLEQELNLTPRGRERLGIMQRAIEDVSQTVARMREFYRKREPELVLGRVDLNALAVQAAEMTRPRWSDMQQERGIVVALRMTLSADLPQVMGVESEIRDALTNLIFNAVDAMPHGGTLSIESKVASKSTPHDEERHVHLEVTDTGIGMDEETRRRCLEPFFTTKGERGTGLGLAMVFGMAERHSAGIEIDSEVGRGTTMRLIFAPVTAIKLTAEDVPAHRQDRPLKLLIIDDDPLVIESLYAVLVSESNVVECAEGGELGIDMFTRSLQTNAPVEAVFTDLGMPYVDGRKVALAVKAGSPSTPVILLTGWGQRLLSDNDIPEGVDHVLSKPPKLRELRAVLGKVAATLTASAPIGIDARSRCE